MYENIEIKLNNEIFKIEYHLIITKNYTTYDGYYDDYDDNNIIILSSVIKVKHIQHLLSIKHDESTDIEIMLLDNKKCASNIEFIIDLKDLYIYFIIKRSDILFHSLLDYLILKEFDRYCIYYHIITDEFLDYAVTKYELQSHYSNTKCELSLRNINNNIYIHDINTRFCIYYNHENNCYIFKYILESEDLISTIIDDYDNWIWGAAQYVDIKLTYKSLTKMNFALHVKGTLGVNIIYTSMKSLELYTEYTSEYIELKRKYDLLDKIHDI